MIKIKGKIEEGFGAASINIPKQKQLIRRYFPEIDNYYDKGSINLLLERPLIIFTPDVKIPEIEWDNGVFEKFGFLKIKFETIPAKENMPLEALIYIPYRSPHYTNPFYKEIIAPKIDLSGIEYCNIIIEGDVKEGWGSLVIDRKTP